MPSSTGRILFISIDGMTDPLGGAQVLPYLERLSVIGHRCTIVSLEKSDRFAEHRERIQKQCDASAIQWMPVAYYHRPPLAAQIANIWRLQRSAANLLANERYDIVHARGLLPALVASKMKAKFGIPYLFDMRGFWADERIEGGIWTLRNPILRAMYAYLKSEERRTLAEADGIVTLTKVASKLIPDITGSQPTTNLEVIPCCVDLNLFSGPSAAERRESRHALGITDDRPVVAYLGSIGTWYMLDEMLEFFRVQLRRDLRSKFLFITQDEPDQIKRCARSVGVNADSLIFRKGNRHEIPLLLAGVDYGLFFIRPTFSKSASSPTKLGELLAVGLPVVANAGVGDVGEIFDEFDAGPLVRQFTDHEYERALQNLAERRSTGIPLKENMKRWFDLDVGVRRYDSVYRKILARSEQRERAY